MARATTSLPEPDAPQIMTEAVEFATRRTMLRNRSIGALSPSKYSSIAIGFAAAVWTAQIFELIIFPNKINVGV
jgi:hypothetical protein